MPPNSENKQYVGGRILSQSENSAPFSNEINSSKLEFLIPIPETQSSQFQVK
jgi:hypothetical protein